MIKVLLVDDEKLALEYLENIINWEYYDFQLVGVSNDTEQALAIYRKYRPDLIISDIRMPGMNGIDFAGTIRENDKNTHILFLSGYQDFNYVKRAIHLGIDDYLLKSDLDEEMFLKKILKLKEEIEKERSKNQYTTSVILEELFYKNTEEQKYKDMLDENEYIRIHKKYYYLILAKKTAPRFVYDFIAVQNDSHEPGEHELKEICNTEAAREEIRLLSFFNVGNDEYLAILELSQNLVSQREMYDRIYGLSISVFSHINKIAARSYCVYYYPKGLSVRRFGIFFQKNKEQLLRRYVKPQVQVAEFVEEGLINSAADKPAAASVSADEIYQAIKSAAADKTGRYIEILRIAVEQEDYYTYLWYVRNLLEAMSRFETSLVGEKSGRQFMLAEAHKCYNPLDANEIIAFLQYKLEQIYTLSNEYNGGAYSTAILEAIDYIRKNYALAELSAGSIAKQVNLSTSWLSTKFKDEVGVGVSDYLNSVRIQKAKQLFDREDYMIYEVAEKVGFTSSQYFSKIFKEFAGVTPNEYKRNK
jgi:YesN/AraC family two-component response regulator